MAVQKMTAQDIIWRLDMVPLGAEGGMVKETWRSKKKDHGISDGSAIYYLLTEDSFSHLHRLTGEEVYHFYMGDPVELCELKQDGSMQITVLGTDLMEGQIPQHLVEGGVWQGSRLKEGGKWALLGTTMCPAYSEEEYEHGNKEELLEKYPEAAAYIEKLTGEVRDF